MQSGVYPLLKPNRLSYCDFSQQGYNNEAIEIPIGKIETFSGSGRVIFSASRYSNGDINSGHDITYDEALIDTASAMDLDNGIFKVPTHGVYQFSFTANNHCCDKEEYEIVDIYVNGRQQFRAEYWWESTGTYTSRSWQMELKHSDQIKLRVTHGSIFANSDMPISFSGYLLKEI